MSASKRLVSLLLVLLVVLIAIVIAARGASPRGCRKGGAAVPRDRHEGGIALGGAEPREIRWAVGAAECLPTAVVNSCRREVRRIRELAQGAVGGYGRVLPAEKSRLVAAAARLSEAHPESAGRITPGLLLALRNLEVSREVQRSGVRVMRSGEAILAAHRLGTPVLDIAARLRLPPVAVLRQLLVESGHSADAARAMVADPSRLPPGLRAELPAILEADLGSRTQGLRTRARSQAFEDAVGGYLLSLGVAYKTEEELRAARLEAPGTPLLTPDFLLESPVMIGGRRVAWIDAKDYPAVDDPLVARSTEKQVRKYTDAFGEGALVYSGGVMCGSKLGRSGVLLLDGSALAAP